MQNVKIKVGQHVFAELMGNAARGKTGDSLIEEWEVTRVGRKYIYAKPVDGGSFSERCFEYREGWGCGIPAWIEKSDYSPNYALYLDKNDAYEKVMKERMVLEIRRNSCKLEKLSFKKIQAIHDLLCGDQGNA